MSRQQLKDRLIEARNEAGYTQPAAVARQAGITPSALYQLEEGKTKSLKAETAQKLARVYKNINVEWLVTGREPKYSANLMPRNTLEAYPYDSPMKGYVHFRLMEQAQNDAYASLRADFPEVLLEMDIAEWKVQQQLGFIPAGDRVNLLTVRGDSHYPKIQDGDVVMVDTKQTSFGGDGFYVIVLNGFGLIKRLQIMSDGMHLLCSNKEYANEVIPASRMHEIKIEGRIVGCAQLRRSEEI